MTLTTWKPFGDLLSLHDRINRVFEDQYRRDIDNKNGSFESWYPATDVMETKDDYVFKLEVPGLSKDDIKVEFNNNILSISGEKKKDDYKDEQCHRVESFSGSFSRSFTLPKNTDGEKIAAKMKDGILELRISKAEEKKARTIAID